MLNPHELTSIRNTNNESMLCARSYHSYALVTGARMLIEFRDRRVVLGRANFVSRGVEHRALGHSRVA